MNTIQCPGCKQILEGEFQMTDELKCPACETSFVPANLIKRTISQSNRPSEVVWAVAILVGGASLLFGITFLRFAIGTMSSQWGMADGAFSVLIGQIPQYILLVFFAWNLFCGKAWARTTFNWLLPIGILVGGLLTAGAVHSTLIESSLNGAPISDFSLRIIPLLCFLVIAGFYGTPLVLINRKGSRFWFSSAKEGSTIYGPKWWIWSFVYGVLLIVLTILIGVIVPKRVGTSAKSNSSDPQRNPYLNSVVDDGTHHSKTPIQSSVPPKTIEIHTSQKQLPSHGKKIPVSYVALLSKTMSAHAGYPITQELILSAAQQAGYSPDEAEVFARLKLQEIGIVNDKGEIIP